MRHLRKILFMTIFLSSTLLLSGCTNPLTKLNNYLREQEIQKQKNQMSEKELKKYNEDIALYGNEQKAFQHYLSEYEYSSALNYYSPKYINDVYIHLNTFEDMYYNRYGEFKDNLNQIILMVNDNTFLTYVEQQSKIMNLSQNASEVALEFLENKEIVTQRPNEVIELVQNVTIFDSDYYMVYTTLVNITNKLLKENKDVAKIYYNFLISNFKIQTEEVNNMLINISNYLK